ncbi:MAG TPA: hypothetical protein VNX65_00315 [Patescibacteria group bacterium]|jgi:hypothetical protein|nr:hypothetical protein [Patescibacteria group bacterium]
MTQDSDTKKAPTNKAPKPTQPKSRDVYLFLTMSALVVVILVSVLSMGKVWQDGREALKGPYDAAEVVEIGSGKYRMYYDIANNPQAGIYSAISSDAVHWKPEPGIRKESGNWPSVVRQPNGSWRMYFHIDNNIKSATSTDGLNWTEEPDVRMNVENPVGLALSDVSEPTVRQLVDGTYLMVYTGMLDQQYGSSTSNNSKTSLFLWATSTDGVTFDRKGLALDSRNDVFKGQVNGPQLVKWTDNTMHLFFWSKKGIYESPFKNDSFVDPRVAFSKGESSSPSNSPPADPALLKVGDKWFMYYQEPNKGIYYATLGN